MQTFNDLHLPEALLKSIADSGYTTPTPIQAQAIPLAVAGRDLQLSAQTGSGKTAAFVLPILTRLIESEQKGKRPRALILTPTRELALQVHEQVRKYGKELKWLFSVPLVGGAPYGGQIRALKKGVQIIIATPGRLLDHMRDERIDCGALDMLVLDEADRMLDMGFADDINAIIEALPETRQTIMSSATWDGAVGKIARRYTREPERIAIKVESAHIEEKVYFCDNAEHKNQILEHLVADPEMGQAIIFAATKRASEEIADSLREAGRIPADALLDAGLRHLSGCLELIRIPFVPQHEFDQVLWLADMLLVRGEDSFVRAQYAAKPFFWHIYPQDENAHLDKLAAFWRLPAALMPDSGFQAAFTALSQELNGGGALNDNTRTEYWRYLLQNFPAWQRSAERWQQQLLAQSDSITRLLQWHRQLQAPPR